jgi:1-deoxy-D-xylulose-5-phosphate reductoisomerase
MPKTLSILGSTGSIGTSTLAIASRFPERFRVRALAAKSNIDRLAVQIERFSPQLAVVIDKDRSRELEKRLPPHTNTEIAYGDEGYRQAATLDGVQMVVGAMVGAAGLLPTLAAVEAGKDVALANKESLVLAGELVMRKAAANGARVLPVDSEHSAIFQSLAGQRRSDVLKIILTASGGPFLNRQAQNFDSITPADALKHPNWSMGSKITIDSATLMNKGLEVIEAKWLFDVSQEQIEVLIHPQSIIHSMVAYRDGSIIAQLGVPDMKTAIAYALSYPQRLALDQPLPDFAAIGALTFQAPDTDRFPCLGLAFRACASGGTLPAVMNGANEVAVEAFLAGKLGFTAIAEAVKNTMDSHRQIETPDLPQILAADRWARQATETWINTQAHPVSAQAKQNMDERPG